MNKKNFAIINLLALSLILLSAATTLGKDKWINLRSKNFNVISNADEASTRPLAAKLEQFRAVFAKFFHVQTAEFPATVIVFKNDDSFKPYKPLYNGKPANIGGYFANYDDDRIIALNLSNNEMHPLTTIFHEYTHLLTSGSKRAWPVWLSEGVAELYSTFTIEKNRAVLGIPIGAHVALLRQKKFLPLQTLFNVDAHSPEYNERDKQGVFYAESWALAHYLVMGNKGARQQQFVTFINLLYSGIDTNQAFAQAFNTDYASMEKDLLRYITADTYTVLNVDLEALPEDQEITAQPLSDAQLQFYLGDLLLHTDRMDEAEKSFKNAATLDANLAQPYEGLGFIAIRKQQFKDAENLFKMAIAHNSTNYLARYFYVEAIYQNGAQDSNGVIKAETANLMIAELKTVIKLSPAFAKAYNLLAFTYLASDQNYPEGIEMAKISLKIAPQEKQFILTLAQLQTRNGEFATAKKTIEPLLGEDNEPEIRAAALSLMTVIDSAMRNGS
jgi:tetratricopeptide (TPR) repeat protein